MINKHDLAYYGYKKQGPVYIGWKDLCVFWALKSVIRESFGSVVRLKVDSKKITKQENHAILFTYFLIRKYLKDIVPPRFYKVFVGYILVNKLGITSCKRIEEAIKKSKVWSQSEKDLKKHLNPELAEKIQSFVFKIAYEVSQSQDVFEIIKRE